jgi:hypothetical protein
MNKKKERSTLDLFIYIHQQSQGRSKRYGSTATTTTVTVATTTPLLVTAAILPLLYLLPADARQWQGMAKRELEFLLLPA